VQRTTELAVQVIARIALALGRSSPKHAGAVVRAEHPVACGPGNTQAPLEKEARIAGALKNLADRGADALMGGRAGVWGAGIGAHLLDVARLRGLVDVAGRRGLVGLVDLGASI